jgi:hypothetical protein
MAGEQRNPVFPAYDSNRPVTPGMILGYLDLAITGVLDYSKFAGVYLGPWWDLGDLVAMDGVQVWKRAVLRRIPNAGAQHWGHLYLVTARTYARVELTPETLGFTGKPSKFPMARVQLREGDPQAVLFVRPSRNDSEANLSSFVREIVDRFVYQRD